MNQPKPDLFGFFFLTSYMTAFIQGNRTSSVEQLSKVYFLTL